MIQIYEKGNTEYEQNGDMTLFPRDCDVYAELNGTWKMEMTHPKDTEGRWKYIEEECVISADTFMGKRQLFRIRETEKSDTEIKAIALPVFLDAEDDCYLMDVRPTAKNGQQALDIMMKGTIYSGESNITSASTAYFETRNLINAINGREEPTFIGRWGGEILYDNYKIIINERVGGDYGVEARYGKNIEGLNYHVDMSGVITRIIPISYNGYKMSGDEPWVDSDNIEKYEKRYIRKIKFDDVKMREDAQNDDEEKGIIVCDSQEELDEALTVKCREQFKKGIDLPVVSIEIDMRELSKTEEYKEFEILETVGLGDDIRCLHGELGIATKERVISITWDCCNNRLKNVVLGENLYDCFTGISENIESALSRIENAIRDDGSIVAGEIKGFIDAAKTQLKIQNTVAKRQDVRAILFEDLDPESELFGALALGTQGLEISNKRTADGRDWEWTTALTAKGLFANIVVTGILSDKKGLNYWNMDTGEFSLSSAGFKVEGEPAEEFFKEDWTQEKIFNLLTNNRKIQGITMASNGELYINAEYINGVLLKGVDVLSRGTGFLGSVLNGLYVKLTKGKVNFMNSDYNEQLPAWELGHIDTDYNMNFFVDNNNGRKGFEYFIQHEDVPVMSLQNATTDCRKAELNLKGKINIYTDEETGGIWWDDDAHARNNGIVPLKSTSWTGGNHCDGTKIEGKLVAYQLVTQGSKNRVVKTDHYSDRLLYCYEMASPMFGDIGTGKINSEGECCIDVDDIFTETANTDINYYVFLQKHGKGDLWIEEKKPAYFLVKGTKGLEFSWEIKVKQREFEYERMKMFDELEPYKNINYEEEFASEAEQLRMKQEEMLYETIRTNYVDEY